MNRANAIQWTSGKLMPVPTRTFGTIAVDMFAHDPEVSAGEWSSGGLHSVAQSLPPAHLYKTSADSQPAIELEFGITATSDTERTLTSAMQIVATLHNSLEGVRWTCGATSFDADRGFASIIVMPDCREAARLEAVADKVRATDWSRIGATLRRVHLAPAA